MHACSAFRHTNGHVIVREGTDVDVIIQKGIHLDIMAMQHVADDAKVRCPSLDVSGNSGVGKSNPLFETLMRSYCHDNLTFSAL